VNILKLLALLLLGFSSLIFAQDSTVKEAFQKFNQECQSNNFKSCYEVGLILERNNQFLGAIETFTKSCKGYDPACKKLAYGSEEVFDLTGISGAQRNKAYEPIAQCREKAYAGCYNLHLIYEKAGKEKLSNWLLQRACKGEVESACYKLAGDKSSWMLFYASIFLVGLVCFIIANSFLEKEEAFKAAATVGEAEKKEEIDYKKFGTILSYSRPFFKRYFTPIVAGMKGKKALKDKYRRTLAAAGLTEAMTAEDFMAFKIFLVMAFPILFIAIRAFLEETWPLKLIPALAAVGYIYPDIWIRGLADKRKMDILSNMPFAVDMLALSVEAGLDFIAAMAKVIEKARPSALTEEFNIVLKEIKIGASRAEGLRNLAWRVDMIPISSFCATLIAADSVGANIGPILKNLSVEIRQKKSAEVEKAGATAATKILFPMLFLIVPAVFIIVAAPIVLEMITGGK
jgi:tight adherence protein C